MTKVFYNSNLKVNPFIIAPAYLTNQEYSPLLMPRAINSDALTQKLYSAIAEAQYQSQIIVQSLTFANGLVFAITFNTNVLDSESGRLGLKLTIGAVIPKKSMSMYPELHQTILDLYEKYFQTKLGLSLQIDGANTITRQIQQFPEKKIDFEILLKIFESKFHGKKQGAPTRAASILMYFRLLKHHQIYPCSDISDIKDATKNIDSYFYGTTLKRSDIPFETEETNKQSNAVHEADIAYRIWDFLQFSYLIVIFWGAYFYLSKVFITLLDWQWLVNFSLILYSLIYTIPRWLDNFSFLYESRNKKSTNIRYRLLRINLIIQIICIIVLVLLSIITSMAIKI